MASLDTSLSIRFSSGKSLCFCGREHLEESRRLLHTAQFLESVTFFSWTIAKTTSRWLEETELEESEWLRLLAPKQPLKLQGELLPLKTLSLNRVWVEATAQQFLGMGLSSSLLGLGSMNKVGVASHMRRLQSPLGLPKEAYSVLGLQDLTFPTVPLLPRCLILNPVEWALVKHYLPLLLRHVSDQTIPLYNPWLAGQTRPDQFLALQVAQVLDKPILFRNQTKLVLAAFLQDQRLLEELLTQVYPGLLV